MKVSRREHFNEEEQFGLEIGVDSTRAKKKQIASENDRKYLLIFLGTIIAVFSMLVMTGLVNYFDSASWADQEGAWRVEKESCSCNCWDRRIKGKTPPFPKGRYKSIYINSDATTIWIILITVVYVTSAVKLIEKTLNLVVNEQDRIRYELLAVLPLTIYANIYSWWLIITYLNDQWFEMIWHQSYFAVTEWLVTLAIYKLIDKKELPVHLLSCWTVFTITTTHTIQNFINGSLFGETSSAPLRDFVLMASDLALLIISARYLKLYQKLVKNDNYSSLVTNRHLAIAIGVILSSVLLLTFVIPTPW